MLRMPFGLIRPDAGTIRLFGRTCPTCRMTHKQHSRPSAQFTRKERSRPECSVHAEGALSAGTGPFTR
jgi:hypothetical protein